MSKAQNKTQPDKAVSCEDFIAGVEPARRREDAGVLLDLFTRITGETPTMWGPTIIGFGKYHYIYESGREGDSFRLGFSPRKANMVVYIMPGYLDLDEELSRLGKHRIGKSCLYINKLSDVDVNVLEEIAKKGMSILATRYPEGA